MAPEPKDMRRHDMGVKHHGVLRAVPKIAAIGEQIVQLIGLALLEIKILETEPQPTCLDLMGSRLTTTIITLS